MSTYQRSKTKTIYTNETKGNTSRASAVNEGNRQKIEGTEKKQRLELYRICRTNWCQQKLLQSTGIRHQQFSISDPCSGFKASWY